MIKLAFRSLQKSMIIYYSKISPNSKYTLLIAKTEILLDKILDEIDFFLIIIFLFDPIQNIIYSI